MTQRRRPATAAGGGRLLLLSLLLGCAAAQPSPPGGGDNSTTNNNPYGFNTNFNPSMAIVIVVLISAFFFLGFFSIYIRQCGGGAADPSLTPNAANRAARSRRQRGLDPALLSTFPTLVYSEVKELKIGKGSLECAVCLSEFDDDETLRLLPGCSHVFHPDCIDAWLANHVTCPVCRSNLSETPNPQAPAADDQAAAAASSSAAAEIAIDIQEERKEELAELARIGSRRRGGLPRSHSTGHSLVLVHERTELDNHDRFTLRLPESVRKEIVSAGRMRRAESSRGFPLPREGSSRRGYRGEGSARGGRSIRLGRSDRWPSFMLRNFSARMPAWATGWRSERDGSVKKGEERDGSARGRRGSVRTQFDCLGGAAAGGQELAAGPGRV